MTIDNGDLPAMPITVTETFCQFANTVGDDAKKVFGLSKREHFAALAMQSVAAKSGWHVSPSEIAAESAKLADALLAELERTK